MHFYKTDVEISHKMDGRFNSSFSIKNTLEGITGIEMNDIILVPLNKWILQNWKKSKTLSVWNLLSGQFKLVYRLKTDSSNWLQK